MNDYCSCTGAAFRWPDVLDAVRRLDEATTAARIANLCDIADHDLRAAVAFALPADIVNRTSDEDWAMANVTDAAIAEQERRRAAAQGRPVSLARVNAPRRLSRIGWPYNGRHLSFSDLKMMIHGVHRRNVV